MTKSKRPTLFRYLAILFALVLASCAQNDPLAADGNSKSETLVIGSQDYYSNEIIAEIYAQALEDAGYKVDRQFRIGQREVYLPELEAGKIDVLPEYTGNLLQYWEPETEARTAEDVYATLEEAMPDGLRALEQADASDQDSYTVTRGFAEKWGLVTIDDLQKVDTPMTLGSNSEAESRPYGPKGLKEAYGVSINFTPIEDSGGPLTIKALLDGDIQLANVYTADPVIAENDLVALEDTKGLFLASHVVPIVSKKVDAEAAKIIDQVSAALSASELIALNARSVNDELSASRIAKEWLEKTKLG